MFIPPGGNIVIPKVGDTVNIGNIDYLVVHIDEANKHLYLAKKYEDSTERGVFNPSFGQTPYEGSTIHTKCKTYYTEKIPESIKPLLVTLDCGYGCPVFIPTRQQVGGTNDSGRDDTVAGEWDYFKDKNSRIFKNESGSAYPWWLQSQWPINSSYVCYVSAFGYVISNNPYGTSSFRPCFCMDISAITKYSVLAELFGS